MTRPDLLVGAEAGVPISARCLAGGGVAAGVSSAFLLAPRAAAERPGVESAEVLASMEAADLAMAEAAAEDAADGVGVPDFFLCLADGVATLATASSGTKPASPTAFSSDSVPISSAVTTPSAMSCSLVLMSGLFSISCMASGKLFLFI